MKIAYRPILGVDFSAAKDAGKKIWVAFARVTRTGLVVERCDRISNISQGSKNLEDALDALRQLLVQTSRCVAGLDFPFGISSQLRAQNDWHAFVRAFPQEFESAEDFRARCRSIAQGNEPKRRTDLDSKTPFAPQNIRLFRQTFHGIRDVLNPLITSDAVRVLPMQHEHKNKPLLVEVCPASTLKKLGLYGSYKDSKEPLHAKRSEILRSLESASFVKVLDKKMRDTIVTDKGGDALDSVVAAAAVYQNLTHPPHFSAVEQADYAGEGYVYC